MIIYMALLSRLKVYAEQYPTRLVYQYPAVGTWIENGASRPDGSILFTSLNAPGGLHTINPLTESGPTLVTNAFDGLNSTLGIVETVPDTFYVIASNFSLGLTTLGTQEGTNTIYKVDLASCKDGRTSPKVKLLARMPRAKFLNGLTKFNDSLLLAADSDLGLIWSISTKSGKVAIAARDRLMAPSPPPNSDFREGINGVRARGNTVCFTNSQQRIFGRVELNNNAKQESDAVQIATPAPENGVVTDWDDFALDGKGTFAYVATLAGNSIQRISLQTGDVSIIAGGLNDTAIAGPTSAVFGRSTDGSGVLYALTTGGVVAPVYTAGDASQSGAQIVAIDLDR